jgi:N-acyl-D-amino-acid deacylase
MRLPIGLVATCLALLTGCARTPHTAAPATAEVVPAPPAKPAYTLVLHNGRVVDGTGNAWFYGDVALRGDRIAFVGTLKPGTYAADREIDVTGLVVAPGFIDVHTHADDDLYRLPQAENFVRDGVTTLVCGNCGGSMRDVGAYFQRLKQQGVGVNVATLIGHGTVLKAVKGNVAGEFTPQQMEQAKGIVDQAMRDGAVGMSTGLIYAPGKWSKTEEIIELQKVASKYGGIYASHMRSEGAEIVEAIDEALRIGREAGCRVEISHFKLPADVSRRLGGSDFTLSKVMAARAGGQEVWLDQYPYTASSTGIGTLLPDWVMEKGDDEGKRILDDPEQVKRVLADMRDNYEVKRKRPSLAYAVVAGCRAHPEFVGKNLREVAQLIKFKRENNGGDVELLGAANKDAPTPAALPEVTMEEQYRAVIRIVLDGGAQGVFHSMAEEDVENILRSPLIAVASDSGVREFGVAQPHPRGYGTNCRVLGRYVRERRAITLEDAIRKMTSLPATAFRFADRGLVREGCVADLVVFDPATVSDKATFEKPHAYSVGMVHVLVNGMPVLENAKMTSAMPGRPLYGPGKSE